MKKLFAASIAAIALSYPTMAAAPPFDTPAPVAFMKDLSSGAILYSKNADQRIPPASLAKMMTVYLAFDMVKQGRVTLDQMIMPVAQQVDISAISLTRKPKAKAPGAAAKSTAKSTAKRTQEQAS